MDIKALAARAVLVTDPEARVRAMSQVLELAGYDVTDGTIDLATTKDGRKSFKNQGKWKHGFIPVDRSAKVAKAKGSDIAMKRMQRLFGGVRPNKSTSSAKPLGRITVKKRGGGSTSATSASRLANPNTPDTKATQRVRLNQFEKNKVGRSTRNANQNWDDIPEERKTVRNGKRFVLTTYKGQNILTEWHGGVREQETKNTNRIVSLTPGDAAKMTTAQLRKLLKDPNSSRAARKIARRALNAKVAQEARTA